MSQEFRVPEETRIGNSISGRDRPTDRPPGLVDLLCCLGAVCRRPGPSARKLGAKRAGFLAGARQSRQQGGHPRDRSMPRAAGSVWCHEWLYYYAPDDQSSVMIIVATFGLHPACDGTLTGTSVVDSPA